ncbi:MAG: integration host factor [Actinomycetes bacterium]|jgi:hypothetical protein|nr:integration host factor [Actinomycetes bacterium]
MALPQLTPEQRAEYLAKAAEMRTKRAKVREELKAGNLNIADVLKKKNDPVIAKIKVSKLLESLPGYGKARAAALREKVGIAENRRVAGLGERQLAELLAELQ